MEIIERVLIEPIHFLNEMSFKDYKIYLTDCKNEDERRRKYDIMKSFCKTAIKTNFETRRIYTFTEGIDYSTGGRLFCGNSIQSIPKIVRGFVFNNTTDIDQINSHPVILKYLCYLNNIKCPKLTNYIKNRDEILSKLGNFAKKTFLCAINNSKINKKVNNKFFKEFDKECKNIHKKILKLEQFKTIADTALDKKPLNWQGSAINRILCIYENNILQETISVINKKNIEIAALMFDGLMIYGNYYDDYNLLREITDKVNEKFEGLNMKWQYKKHDSSIELPNDYKIPICKKSEIKSKIKNGEIKIAKNDKEASDIIYNEIKNVFVYSKYTFYFKQNNIWIYNEKNIRGILVNYILNSNIYKLSDKDELLYYSQNRKNAINIAECVKDKVMVNKNDGWSDNIFNSSLGYLLFNNGYYDFKNSKFINVEDENFNTNIIFMEKIEYNYDINLIDDKSIKNIKDKLFYKPFGENVGDYYILNIARGLAGDCMKRCIFGIGNSNTGKSILTNCCKSSFGGYFGDFNAVNLVYKKSNNDEAQKLRWLMLLQYKRIIISNEMQTGCNIDGNMLKKISNGGLDAITARGHIENEISFKIPFLAIVFANDINTISPKDDAVMNRIKAINYNKIFVDNPDSNNKFELQKDKNLGKEIDTYKFKVNFMCILFDSYKKFINNKCEENEPDEFKVMKDDIVGKEDNIIDILQEDYIITDCEDDYVISSDLDNWIKYRKINISMTKFGLEIKKYCLIKKYKNIFSFKKKIEGKTKTCWKGIKSIDIKPTNIVESDITVNKTVVI